jgi:hypothetical protein
LKDATDLYNWTVSPSGAWKTMGAGTAQGYATTIFVANVQSTFWRIVFVDTTDKTARDISDAGVVRALFSTVGVGG